MKISEHLHQFFDRFRTDSKVIERRTRAEIDKFKKEYAKELQEPVGFPVAVSKGGMFRRRNRRSVATSGRSATQAGGAHIGKFLEKRKDKSTLYQYVTARKEVPTRIRYKQYQMVKSPYDYSRIDSYFSKESYFSRSIMRQVETMMRNGFNIVSEENVLSSYVKKELAFMQMTSGKYMNQHVSRMVTDILKYGLFVGQKIRWTGDNPYDGANTVTNHIRSIRFLNPGNLYFFVNEANEIIGVREMLERTLAAQHNKKTIAKGIPGIPARDLVIGFITDAGDDIFPEPPCFQVIDDILTLRSLEETVELLAFQYGSPLLHIKVGSDDRPANDAEVTRVHDNIQQMAPNGMVTTHHRVDIDSINLQTGIDNIMPYIEHFKNRVHVGSGTSGVSVGEGDTANRSTSESLDDALADRCTYISSIVTSVYNYNILPDIISSKGMTSEQMFDKWGDPIISLQFNEMSLEKMISKINTSINQWEGNLITLSEARKDIKRRPMSKADEKELFVNMVSIPLAKSKGGGAGDESAVNNKVKSQNQPRNQHGTKSGPGSRKD